MQHKKQLFLLLLLSSLLSVGAKAQFYMGLEAGITNNQLYTNTTNLAFTNYKNGSGFSVGIPLLYKVADWFAVQASPSFMQKNYTIERTGYFQGVYQNNTNGYIQLPIMGQFSFGGEQFRGFVNLGMYGAYWASGKVKGAELNPLNPVDTAYYTVAPTTAAGETNLYNYNEKYAFDNTKDRRMEFGWIAGIGLSYETESGYRFFVEGRRTSSFTDQQKNYMINQVARYNDTYGINIGCMIDMSKIFGSFY
jgi:hypothetical protein